MFHFVKFIAPTHSCQAAVLRSERLGEGWESFKTRKEAQERKITVEKELLDGSFLVPDTMTVEEMLYKWIPIQSTKHKWSPKTYTQSVAMVQNLIVPYIGNRKVQELRTYDIEKILCHPCQDPLRAVCEGYQAETFREAEEAAAVQHLYPRSPHATQDRIFLCGRMGLDPQDSPAP